MKKLVLNFELSHHNNFQEFSLSLNTAIPLKGIVGIFGQSGSGKSTLLRAIAGLEKGIDGSISLDDVNETNHEKISTQLSSNKRIIKTEKRKIGLVFQDARLFPHLTVRQNLEFSAKRCKNSSLELNNILQLTELLPLEHMNVTQLSGGQKQRVALARAILSEPELLLLDEPLSALDQQGKSKLLQLISKIHQQLNLPIIYVSHSLAELQYLCDDLVVLSKGRLIEYGNIHTIIHRLNEGNKEESAEHTGLTHHLIDQQTSLSLPIKNYHNDMGLMVLSLSEKQEILLPAKLASTNIKDELPTNLRCFILASDIAISLSDPIDSSIINRLSGKITNLTLEHYRVLVTVECEGKSFFANVSTYSQKKLILTLQQDVFLQFKASAVRTFLY